jgi:hypothetical protein
VATLVVSDLHIGTVSEVDLLRRPELRAPLCERLRAGDIERLVILGDALELRESPAHEVATIAEPVFADLGAALGSGGQIVVTAGNHDHNLLAGWIAQRIEQGEPLDLSHPIDPTVAGPVAERLAQAARPASLSFAYPGLWLRDDVYGVHGHYLDLFTRVPTVERLAVGAMARLLAPLPEGRCSPEDYEAVLAPLYAWMFTLAQRANERAAIKGASSSVSVWDLLAGDGRRKRPVRALALRTGLRAAVAGLQRAGLGPLRSEVSGAALRRGSLEGMGDALDRLGLRVPYAVFGHTHRSGPWPGDDEQEWLSAAGTRLVNTGSWVYQRHFLPKTTGEGPYWPGTAVRIDDHGPPVLERLLSDRGHDELRSPATPA